MNYAETLFVTGVITTLTVTLSIALATIYLKSYLSEKGKMLASREEFQELKRNLIDNIKATESIRLALQRKADARTKGTNELLTCIAEIESNLIHWNLFIYFRKINLPAGSSIEELGRQDLAETANQLMIFNRLQSRYRIYLSDDVSALAFQWSQKIYLLLYDMEAVYKASLEHHKDLQASDEDRLTWISTLFNTVVQPKLDEIGTTKIALSHKLIEYLELDT